MTTVSQNTTPALPSLLPDGTSAADAAKILIGNKRNVRWSEDQVFMTATMRDKRDAELFAACIRAFGGEVNRVVSSARSRRHRVEFVAPVQWDAFYSS